MTLNLYTNSKNNNFDIVRLIFAFLVLFGHSFPISGKGSDPISALLFPHTWIGSIAVHGFFGISGFLVTASFLKRGAIVYFFSRALRIYPAVFIYCLVAILIIGPLDTDLSLFDYFKSKPWHYLYNSLLLEWQINLPNVFIGNPFSGATNGSGWTLPVEIRCYLIVFIFGFFGVFDSKIRANIALLFIFFLIFSNPTQIPLIMFNGELNNINSFMFFSVGAFYWLNKSYIPLSWFAIPIMLIILITAYHLDLIHFISPFCFFYFLLLIIYKLPPFSLKSFGDISFGVYLYAWPIQQIVWRPGQSAYINALYATLLVVPIAYFSWILIEKPALNLRRYFY